MATLIEKQSDLPKETISLLKQGKVTYRGCGMGKNMGNWKINVNKKEVLITMDLFYELLAIHDMKFSAPYRRN